MKYWKCEVCGYIHKGDEPPEKCPVCQAPREKFAEMGPEEGEKAYKAYMEKMGDKIKPMLEKAGIQAEDVGGGEDGDSESGAGPDDAAEESGAGKPSDDEAGKPAAEDGAAAQPSALIQFVFRQMAKHHAHPIAVHMPNGIIPMLVFFLLLSTGLQLTTLLDNPPDFAEMSFYSLCFVLASMPLVLFSGYVDWQERFGGVPTRVIMTKIVCGTGVTLLALVIVVWHLATGGKIADPAELSHWTYVLLHLLMLAFAAYAGHLGGMLVFND